MAFLKRILFTVGIISSFLIQTQGADKYTDENRPYEFGFNIEGEQHRHEKKDEKGLIMGEFGFITADGVYHVTVYATDEQGRFKIISMKNIRVKPYPTYKRPEAGSARQGHSLDLSTPQQTLVNQPSPVQEPKPALKEISIKLPARSCSSCSLPTTTTQAPAPAFVQLNAQNTPFRSNANNFGQNPASVNPQYPQGVPNSFANQQNSFSNQNAGSLPSFPGNQQNIDDNSQTYSQQGLGTQNALGQGLVPPKQDSLNNYPSGPQNSQPEGILLSKQDGPSGPQNLQPQGILLSKQNSPSGPQNLQPQGILLSKQNSPSGPQNLQPQGILLSKQNSPSGPQNLQPQGILLSKQNSPSGPQNLQPQGILLSKQNSPSGPQNLQPQGILLSKQNSPSGPQNLQPQGILLSKQDNYPSGPESAQPQGFGQDDQSGRVGITGGRTGKKYDGQPEQSFGSAGAQPNGIPNNEAGLNKGQALSNKPILISAQMQIVDKNTDVYQRAPGEKEGLPNGLTKGDMTQLLYTFNYTVGFHGHFEEGYGNGAKQGYYYVTGRNGVRTRVDYVADENGFRPTITQEVLDLLSDDVPKPETEKDEKYGLKGYEFKWLYYPVESNGH